MHKSMTAIFLALAPVGALSFVPVMPAQAQQIAISVSLFHQELAPHGRWFQHPRFGWAWFPTEVDSQWRPYAHGQWVWTAQYGWYWNSDEPFGWATYHYGRWGYDEVYGWVWIPGNTWGPAWVAFRYSEGHVGWAPLPPETLGISYGFASRHTDMSAGHYVSRWVFVPRRGFLDARVYTSAVPLTQNTHLIRQTVNVTNYVTVNNVVMNRSIDRQRMETAIGRRIEVARVRDVDDARKSGRRGDTEIEAFRPQMHMTPDATPPDAARAKPGDKPRYAVRKDAIAPSERRVHGRQPDAPPSAAPPEGESDPKRSGKDGRKNDHRGATPAQPQPPPDAPRAAPHEEPGASPVQPAPSPATRRAQPEERRGATPVKPAQPSTADSPKQVDRDREAQPVQPPANVTPSAPPRVQTRPSPSAAPPAKKVDDDEKKDERSKDTRPGR